MKIFKSIKWRLQLWYGLILVIVLAGFGFTAYQLERNRQFRRIDDELHRRVGILADALRRPPPRGQDADWRPFERPPRGQFPDGVPPILQKNRPLPEFHLPEWATHLFDESDPHNFYFTITSQNIYNPKEIARSTNQPVKSYQKTINNFHRVNQVDEVASELVPSGNRTKQPQSVNFDNFRETAEMLP